MPINTLTIQSLQAARQRVAYNGFEGLAGLGDDARPSYDYVRSGDVIRIVLLLDTAFAGLNLSAFRSALGANGGVSLINLDASGLGTVLTGYTGNLIVEVQARSDFARLDDVTRLVAGLAQSAGLNVILSSSRGEFVSKVESTGGSVGSNIPAPNPNAPDPTTDPFGSFFNSLTASPVTLAVILGAVVVLVIAAKK